MSPHTRARGVRACRATLTDARSGRAGHTRHSVSQDAGVRSSHGPAGRGRHTAGVSREGTCPAGSKPSQASPHRSRLTWKCFPEHVSSVSREGQCGRAGPFSRLGAVRGSGVDRCSRRFAVGFRGFWFCVLWMLMCSCSVPRPVPPRSCVFADLLDRFPASGRTVSGALCGSMLLSSELPGGPGFAVVWL